MLALCAFNRTTLFISPVIANDGDVTIEDWVINGSACKPEELRKPRQEHKPADEHHKPVDEHHKPEHEQPEHEQSKHEEHI